MSRAHEYHWVLGDFDHIEFPGGGDPMPAPPTQLSTIEGLACISDSAGSLLMYTDGDTIWDGSLGVSSQLASGLGGSFSTTQSAIIVPPAGAGGTDYHVFAVNNDNQNLPDPVFHSTWRPSGGSMIQVLAPAPVTGLISPGFDNTERLAAISHEKCDQYWVILQDGQSNALHALLVDSDAAPTQVVTSNSNLQQSGQWEGGYMKLSPDGSKMAFADSHSGYVAVLAFDRATGQFSDLHRISETGFVYGVEFSPDSKTLYIASLTQGAVSAHSLSNGAQAFSALPVVLPSAISALQLGPNDKIYCKQITGNSLSVIGQPNTPATPSVQANGTYADGTPISLSPVNSTSGRLGLPTFTRIADACRVTDTKCDEIAEQVNVALTEVAEGMSNMLKPCTEQDFGPTGDACTPLEVPDIAPRLHIAWGQSPCDGLESTDTEVMTLTICNPYSNVTLTGLTLQHMSIATSDGEPVPTLPGGDPSMTLVPRGPICFGDIDPCSCKSREFVVQTLGAEPGEYTLQLEGLCFDVCLHQNLRACFNLPICKD